MSLLTIPAKKIYDAFQKSITVPKKEFYKRYKMIQNLEFYQNEFPSTCKWIQSCYNKPKNDDIRMEMLDELLNLYGIEYIDKMETKNGYYIDYVNNGDPYISTIIYCSAWRYKFRLCLGGWGDYVKISNN